MTSNRIEHAFVKLPGEQAGIEARPVDAAQSAAFEDHTVEDTLRHFRQGEVRIDEATINKRHVFEDCVFEIATRQGYRKSKRYRGHANPFNKMSSLNL